jgi:molecular chaperone DnaK (HSP70)
MGSPVLIIKKGSFLMTKHSVPQTYTNDEIKALSQVKFDRYINYIRATFQHDAQKEMVAVRKQARDLIENTTKTLQQEHEDLERQIMRWAEDRKAARDE